MTNEVQTKKIVNPHQNGTPLLIAVGAQGFLQISTDGEKWQSAGKFTEDVNLTTITFSPVTKQFVCLGVDHTGDQDGQSIGFISNDGKNWKKIQNTSAHAYRILWHSLSTTDGFFIALGRDGIIETSEDGLHWRRVQSPVVSNLSGLIWNKNAEEFVAVGAKVVLTSKNGRVWQQVNAKINYNLRDIVFNASSSQYLAVTDTAKVFLISSDAKTWTVKNSDAMDQPNYSIFWCDSLSKYFAAGLSQTICSSPDGEQWTKRYPPSHPQQTGQLRHLIRTLIWSEAFNKLIAADQNCYIYTSSDGLKWDSKSLENKDLQTIYAIAEGWVG